MKGFKEIKSNDKWIFKKINIDNKRVLELEFEDLSSDSTRADFDNVSNISTKHQTKKKSLLKLKEIWQWLYNFPLNRRRSTTIMPTTLSMTSSTTESYLNFIGRKRRHLKYTRTCEFLIVRKK